MTRALARAWEPHEDATLIGLIQELGARPSWVVIPGRTQAAKDTRVQELRKQRLIIRMFIGPRKKASHFTNHEVALLRANTVEAEEGKKPTLDGLVRLLPRHTKDSLRSSKTRYGCADPKLSEIAKEAKKRSTPERRKALLDLLTGKGRWWPATRAARKSGYGETRVIRVRRKHGLDFTHRQGMQIPAYRKWTRQQQKQMGQTKKQKHAERFAETRCRLKQRMSEIRKIGKKYELLRCSMCNTQWEKSDEFFHTRSRKPSKKNPSGKHLVNACIACPWVY